MRLVDANLMIYAYVAEFPQHAAAHAWLQERLNNPEPLGLPWPSLLAFVRLVSNPRVFESPRSVAAAWLQVEQWIQRPCVWIPAPSDRHQAILGGLLSTPGLTANHVPDAHLAALAIEHHLTLCTADAGFARFAGLKWENPI
jgi:uncharacterized protein